ncbi:hypothetical protein AB1L30_19235 [Bremerella sp. JC817]|uniref:hypothetical protein n=1 Tax=Bremerella sp. JC817 TaxID=3231756 RepID=UPI0034576C28
MNNASSFVREFILRAKQNPALRKLHAIEAAFQGFSEKFPQRRSRLMEGPLSFGQFSNWVARKYGKSRKSIHGRWTRYEGSAWRMIAEKFGSDEAGYEEFVDLFDRFKELTIHRIAVAKSLPGQGIYDVMEVEAWKCTQDEGVFLNLISRDGNARVEGYYASLDELLRSAEAQYHVKENCWEFEQLRRENGSGTPPR